MAGGVACPACGSCNIQTRPARFPQPYRCRDCRTDFSAKTGTLLHGSKLGFRVWVIAIYLLGTSPKGVSSITLARHLGITQKSAWFLAHRIREEWEDSHELLVGPVEVDEAFVGGLERNKHADKKLHAGRGTVGKMPVAGIRDEGTGEVRAAVVEGTDRRSLQGFVHEHVARGASVYTDTASAYAGLSFGHHTVNHSIGEYVAEDGTTTNGIESFWALLKRAHKGVYHLMSPKHLHRYVREFVARHNRRPLPALNHMAAVVAGMEGKRLTYEQLKAPNGLDSGARA